MFCWYFRNFIGKNYILVGLHVTTDLQMYRQNSEKSIIGRGQLPAPPPPPPLATLVSRLYAWRHLIYLVVERRKSHSARGGGGGREEEL